MTQRPVSLTIALLAALLLPIAAFAKLADGSVAPSFRLQDQNSAWVNLADYKGKWVVVYFYPMDDTPGCTTEACTFRDDIFAFRRMGVSVLGISVQGVASKKEFAEKYSLPFPVLADEDKAVAKAYGVLSMFRIASRETFIVDPQGKIAKHYPDVDPKTHSAQLQADLRALIQPVG